MIRVPFLARFSLAWLLTCSLAVLVTGAAVAEEDLPPTSQFFEEYDQNADGKVTAAEFRGAGAVFKLLDRDGDGAITPSELGLPADYKPARKAKVKAPGGKTPGGKTPGGKAGGQGGGRRAGAERADKMRQRLKAMDTDGDGKVSREEFKGPAQLFDRLDRNKDGNLDKADRPKRDRPGRDGAAPQGGGRGRPGAGGPEGDGPKRGGRGAGRPTPEQMKQRLQGHFKKLDKNEDGKLSGDELPNPGLLKTADKDKDGSLTFEEFEAFAAQRMRGRRGQDRADQGEDRGPQGRDGRNKDREKRGGGDRAGDGDRRRGGRISSGMLRRWDRDDDGKVSPDEFPGRDEAFKRFDTDGDGFLTEKDTKAAPEAEAPKQASPAQKRNVIQSQDQDGDGRLNRAEFRGTNEEWRRLDKDGDGWVTPQELGTK